MFCLCTLHWTKSSCKYKLRETKFLLSKGNPAFQGQNFTANEVISGSKLPALTVTTSTNNLLNTTDNLNLPTDETHIPFLVPGNEYASCTWCTCRQNITATQHLRKKLRQKFRACFICLHYYSLPFQEWRIRVHSSFKSNVPPPESRLVSGNRNQSHQKGERERERDVWSLYKCRVKIFMLYVSLWERIDSLYWITSLLQSISSKWNAAISQPWQPASHIMDKPITGAKPNEAQKAAMTISHYQSSSGQWLISFHTDHIRN